jgi:hypothetical protein
MIRKGLWLNILSVHLGLPGPSGEVREGQFHGGLADVNTAWPLSPGPTLGLIDAVPIAGFFCFGTAWPAMFEEIGLPSDFKKLVESLRKEFGELALDQLKIPTACQLSTI